MRVGYWNHNKLQVLPGVRRPFVGNFKPNNAAPTCYSPPPNLFAPMLRTFTTSSTMPPPSALFFCFGRGAKPHTDHECENLVGCAILGLRYCGMAPEADCASWSDTAWHRHSAAVPRQPGRNQLALFPGTKIKVGASGYKIPIIAGKCGGRYGVL